MSSVTVRLSERARDALRALAAEERESMQNVLEKAIEHYRRERFFDAADAAYLALRNDPEAWKEELAERQLWEVTLGDDLDQDESYSESQSGGDGA